MIRWFLILLGIAISSLGHAQIRFEAAQDAKQVLEGDYLKVTYTLYNARGTKLQPPNFKGFKRLGSPSQSFQQTSVNGRVSFQSTYSYTLLAQSPGKYKIGIASIEAEGKTYTSNTLEVEVVKREGRKEGAEVTDPVYVNIELTTDTAYLGQQVLLDYKLYTTVDVRNFDIRYEPEYPNTFAVNIPTYNNFPQQREIIKGTSYVTKVMKRVALFPMQIGTVVFEPSTIRIGIAYEDKNSRSFFFRSKVRMEQIQTNEASLVILPLPPNQPNDFNGAVGKYNMKAYVTQSTAKTNEAMSLRMNITGNGDEKRLIHPTLDFGDNFDVYDPKVINANNDLSGPVIQASKQLEYLIVPKQAGIHTLTPSFSYFDPDSARFFTIVDSLKVRILPGAGGESQVSTVVDQSGKEAMQFIRANQKLRPITNQFYGSLSHILLLILPLIGLGAGIFYKRHLIKEGKLDASVIKNRRARKVALQRLKLAEEYKAQGDARNFYDEISKASLGYVSDKYNIAFSELSKTNIKETIASKGFDDQIQERFLNILNTAEMALFAGQTSAANLESIYGETLDLITEMES